MLKWLSDTMVAERRLRAFVERELNDLVPLGTIGAPDYQRVIQEELRTGGPDAQPIWEVQSLIEALCSPSVPVFSQEELNLVGIDLECNQEAAEHVANAVGRQVALHEQPVVHPQDFAE